MVLVTEVFVPQGKQWVEAGSLKPGDRYGSISDTRPDGRRDVYVFECLPGNAMSRLYLSYNGTDIADAHNRTIVSAIIKPIVELKEGMEYDMKVKTDTSPERRWIRFRHV